MKPLISLIYVYYNVPDDIIKSLKSIPQAIKKYTYEIIVVDNNSSIPPPAKLKGFGVKLLSMKQNFGYGKALNLGAKQSKGRYLLFLNPDTIFDKNSIDYMIDRIEREKKIGAIGPQMRSRRGVFMPTFTDLPLLPQALVVYSFFDKIWPNNPVSKNFWKRDVNKNEEQFVDMIGGACILVRENIFRKINGFDERFFLYFEEADLCQRIKNLKYKILYFPKAKIIHTVGKSSQDKKFIEKNFEKSRFIFFRKYHGILLAGFAELFLRFLKLNVLLLAAILCLSLFLNLYRIDSLMVFFGDIGRDYLAARDMVLTGKIPYVGIQSSVVWLHQGPLSIYLIGIAFILSSFHPVAPAIFYGLIGVVTTYIVFLLGRNMFGTSAGLISSLLYASSPLVLINTRMPYHSSLIPFFASIFFLFLFKVVNNKYRYIFPLFFISGLLLQVELSNAVIFPIITLLYLVFKPSFSKRHVSHAITGLLMGIIPFILYDLTHGFTQTIGFPIWVINRIRLFFGLTMSGASTTANAPEAVSRVYQQLTGIIFPANVIIFWLLIGVMIFWIINRRRDILKKNKSVWLVLSWLFVPVVAFIVHTTPGTAYFPLIFPVVSLILALSLISINKQLAVTCALLISFFNIFLTLQKEYYVITNSAKNTLPPTGYSYGYSYVIQHEVIDYIVKDAKNRKFAITGGGFLGTIKTGVDNYKYIAFYLGGNVSDNAELSYTIYEETVPQKGNPIFKNKYIYVIRNTGIINEKE